MGKKQVRAQMRQVKRKPPTPGQLAQGTTRKQRERYVEAGGMLQGYAPDFVVRLGYIAVGVAVACLIVMAVLILVLRPVYGWADAIVAAVAWLMPIALLASFVAPGFRLALKDRRAEAKLVQGQLIGASTVSNSMGLGLLMVQTRGGSEQYLVPPARLKQIPGNQVNVVLTVTPYLRHVRSVGIMGQRMVGRVEPPVPPVMRQLQRLPVLTPIALSLAVILGDDILAAVPVIDNETLHAVLAVAVGTALGVLVYFGSTLLQRRMMAEAQALVPTR
ncbi:MAG TPA: hypothetical protein VER07_02575 [Candidatus Polarisedimenticolia bacterium]|nr:hypothetical protein [Candidatus Polarisedimenticolia bacterium]